MSGSSSDAGRGSGYLVVGEVLDIMDPWQSGQVKVKWSIGSAVQDSLGKEDVPWTKSMFPSTNRNLNRAGGPHTGLRVGSKVYGFPTDGAGQDFIIMGSVGKAGDGKPDEDNQANSDITTGAKEESMDGISQPRYGDHNDVAKDHDDKIISDSIIEYARKKGGPQKRQIKYDDGYDDSIGDMKAIGGDSGGGESGASSTDESGFSGAGDQSGASSTDESGFTTGDESTPTS